jgi:hypothetical protein
VPRRANSRDAWIRRVALEFEPEDVLERQAGGAAAIVGIFGVSGKRVTSSGPGCARRADVEAAGFRVHDTPRFGDGHVTIELPDPVTPAVANAFNALFGRSP